MHERVFLPYSKRKDPCLDPSPSLSFRKYFNWPNNSVLFVLKIRMWMVVFITVYSQASPSLLLDIAYFVLEALQLTLWNINLWCLTFANSTIYLHRVPKILKLSCIFEEMKNLLRNLVVHLIPSQFHCHDVRVVEMNQMWIQSGSRHVPGHCYQWPD